MLRLSLLVLAFTLVCNDAAAQGTASSGDSRFALHAGVAYARVPDADFEVVQALSGQDLFSQIKARESATDFVVFLSQRLSAALDRGPRAYATLGTAVSDPGSMLYFRRIGGHLANIRHTGRVDGTDRTGRRTRVGSGVSWVGRSHPLRQRRSSAGVGILCRRIVRIDSMRGRWLARIL
jgi:hypothetical protein